MKREELNVEVQVLEEQRERLARAACRHWRGYLDDRRARAERTEAVQVTVLLVVTLGLWTKLVLMIAGYGL